MAVNGLEARWDDLVDFVQKGRYLYIYQKGTDGLQGRIKGRGPWYTYTWSANNVREFYNERMKESWVMSHACDF